MSLTACCIGDSNASTGRRRRPDQGGTQHRPEIDCLLRCCVGDAVRCAGSPRYKPLERVGSFDMPPRKPRKTHRRAYTAVGDPTAAALMEEGAEPRLVRSGGMRREWSFEDLGDQRESSS